LKKSLYIFLFFVLAGNCFAQQNPNILATTIEKEPKKNVEQIKYEIPENVPDQIINNRDREEDLLIPPPLCDTCAPEIYTVVEENAEFPSGINAMGKFIQQNLKIPQQAIDAGLGSTKIFLRFIVNETGEISNVEVLKGVIGCPDCDKEAVRVVKSMPKWKPALVNGKSVKSFFNLPMYVCGIK